MYSGSGFTVSELGDIDVVYADGTYHLFHLVLPNHDYIAHAVSQDGFVWRRVENALFIGHPGHWDDDMLWTMHVSRNPHVKDEWRMFYTGLSRRESGRVQRVGMARSTDLYHWEKDTSGAYPLEIPGTHYESSVSEGRNWVSFRDPSFYCEGDERLLLANARVNSGPVIRRGCVSLAREIAPDRFEFLEPLFCPRMYDDVEVPCLFKVGETHYLTGSIREDRKVHYWHASELLGTYSAHYDNLLLPQGNYAARVLHIEGRNLVWNFFVTSYETVTRILPPPKELVVGENQRLLLQSFHGFDSKASEALSIESLTPLTPVLQNPTGRAERTDGGVCIECESGYEVFHLALGCTDFRLRCSAVMEGRGKFGMVFRSDREANGYFVSLDMVNGIVQVRAWGIKGEGKFEDAFRYESLQEHHFLPHPKRAYDFELIAYGGYIEFSVGGIVVLSLIDTSYTENDRLGFYVESAQIRIDDLTLEPLHGPSTEDYGPM
jgi:beta-fructofuranosidase